MFNLSFLNSQMVEEIPATYISSSIFNIKNISFNKIIHKSITSSGILTTDLSGNISFLTIPATTQFLFCDGNTWSFVTNIMTGSLSQYSSDSDLSGFYTTPSAKNISSVNSGILSAKNGGTGLSSFISGSLMFKDSSSTIKMIQPTSIGNILVFSGSNIVNINPATQYLEPQSFYFTCSNKTTTTTYSWVKPYGYRKLMIILMGGGGGGGQGAFSANNVTGVDEGGGGGGAGAFSVYETECQKEDLNCTVIVGGGGIRGEADGTASGTKTGVPGGSGGASSFAFLNTKLAATGGSGGAGGGASKGANGISAIGNTGLSSGVGGAGGGRGGNGNSTGTIGNTGGVGDANAFFGLTSLAGGVGGTGQIGANNWDPVAQGGKAGDIRKLFYGYPPYYAYISGGGGGGGGPNDISSTGDGYGGYGADGAYGSGGGGGGADQAANGTYWASATRNWGGHGGAGYVIVVAYN